MILYFKIFSMELKKVFSYRIEFWAEFLGSLFFRIFSAYFLWQAIFTYNEATELKGFSFWGIIWYTMLVALVNKITGIRSFGTAHNDIYSGSLNKYIVYPASYYNFKYIENLSSVAIGILQLFLVLSLALVFLPQAPDVNIQWQNIILGLIICLLANFAYFNLLYIISAIAFWADNIWSLVVLLRFIIMFFGGSMVPLSFFPEYFMDIANILPGKHIISLPILTFLGKATTTDITNGIQMLCLWSVIFFVAQHLIWQTGKKRYSGVGI